jgi:hypothetical protein
MGVRTPFINTTAHHSGVYYLETKLSVHLALKTSLNFHETGSEREPEKERDPPLAHFMAKRAVFCKLHVP